LVKIEEISKDIALGWLDFGLFTGIYSDLTKRELERKGSVFLLGEMLKLNPVEISYDEHNKPFLIGRSEHISISHSHKWLVVVLHKTCSVGVDVELIREKVLNIKHKFVADDELAYAAADIEMITLLWSAKEAIYKAYGKKNVDFKSIQIAPFVFSERGELYGTLHLPQETLAYKLHYCKQGDYILALTTDEIKL
jgi:4'-phosphopantetheinyl transferase